MTQHYLALSVLSASLLGLSACGGSGSGPGPDPEPINVKPIAVISGYQTTNLLVGDSLNLSASASKDDDGSIESYLWSGSALSATQDSENIPLSFTEKGEFQLTLKVMDNDGDFSEKTITFTITEREDNKQVPVAKITPDVFLDKTINSEIILDASGSTDDGEITKYLWNDGQIGAEATFKLIKLGKQTFTVTVTDDDGLSSQASVDITVVDDSTGNNKPSAKITLPAITTIEINQEIILSGAGSSDPDGDKLTYLWSNGKTTEQAAFSFEQPGLQIISLTVGDGVLSSTVEGSITVIAPCDVCIEPTLAVISPATSQSIYQGESLNFSAANSTGKALSYEWSTGEDSKTIIVDFDTVGAYTLTLTVTDGGGNSATQSVDVNVLAPKPNNAIVYYYGNASPTIYAWNEKPSLVEYTNKWPGQDMEAASEMGSDWYQYDLGVEVASSGVIFNSGDDLVFNSTAPCYKDGSWTADCLSLLDPDFDNQAPSITATPVAGYYSDKTTLDVVLNISDNKDPAPLAYYSLDGSSPTASSTEYTGAISIDDEQVKGADATIKVLAIDKKGNSTTASFAYYLNEQQLEKPDPMQLGAIYSSDSTLFRIWSPDSGNVKVRVAGNEHSLSKLSDFDGYSNVYEVEVQGDLHLEEYTFAINGSEARDPYGKMAKPQSNTNVVLNMSLSDLPGGWSPTPELKYREDAVIYEVHVRDFTLDSSSGVSSEKRGRYLGMVEGGTTYQNVKTGIDHLKELGVTHVQLLPVYDYGTCDGQKDCFNWGYDPRNYNVPEDSYSQYAGDAYLERAKEFKMMVDEFHKAGFRVVMDVVYNHTYAKEMFKDITGSYYHSFGDMSGCSNSIDASVPMVSRMIQDSLDYWVGEYNIDGFRFDLIGIFTHIEVQKWGKHINEKYPERNILLYGEPWDGYYRGFDPEKDLRVSYGTTFNLVEEHVGVFNGAFREAIKGKNDEPACAYMCNKMTTAESKGAGLVDGGKAIVDGLRGSPKDPSGDNGGVWGRSYTKDPEQTINYISAHDNYGLWDKVYLATAQVAEQVDPDNGKHQLKNLTPPADLNYSKKVVNFGMGMVLASQGIPFIHAGDEFLRTKTNNADMTNVSAWNYGSDHGTHNTYNAPDSFNKIRWNWKVENAATFKYFKDIIEIRKNHAGMRMNTNEEIDLYLDVKKVDEQGHLITAHSTYPQDSHDLFIVVNNASGTSVSLPSGTWTQIADSTGKVSVSGLSGSTQAEGTAVSIYRKD